jgi:hypothetical protein
MLVSTSTLAATPMTVYPERIGAETARFDHGNATVHLEGAGGAVDVRPLPARNGRLLFAVAVINKGDHPVNFGIENLSAAINGIPVVLPTHDQLVSDAQNRARNKKIGVAIFSGILAGVASTASFHQHYQQNVYTRHGVYTNTISWHDDTPGILGATAAVGAGALVIHGIDRKLDYTLNAINNRVLETTTVDRGSSFGGVVVVPMKDKRPSSEVRLQVSFDGVLYPFAFRVGGSSGQLPPPLLPATVQPASISGQPAPLESSSDDPSRHP